MFVHVFAVLALAGTCAAWVVLQRWIAHRDPDLGSRVERERGGCGACGDGANPRDAKESCSGTCHN